jgi:hypothetical protein
MLKQEKQGEANIDAGNLFLSSQEQEKLSILKEFGIDENRII